MNQNKRLRVTFVCPPVNLSGGIRVCVIQAKGLERLGHEVTFVSPPLPRPSVRDRLRAMLRGRPQPRYCPTVPSHLDGTGLRHIVIDDFRPVTDRDVPDADVVIATWWETAEWVAQLSPSKGAKVYFVQHHEVFESMPLDRVHATYRLPMHKITIAQWLSDVMKRDYGDDDCTLVPNSVDHQQFHALPRQPRPIPTIGLSCVMTSFKGVPTALEAIRRTQTAIGQIAIHTFMQNPYPGLPEDLPFASIRINPPQDTLREIYASCDVWLTASVSEGFNLPAMEAMACRTPVVSTRTGWPAEAIHDGVNGYLCEVGDVEGLSAALVKVLSQTSEAWQAMSEAAWQTVKDSSWEASVARFEAGLMEALDRRAKGEI